MNRMLIGVLFFLITITVAHAQIPRTISYQGILTDASGIVKPDGNYSITFSLYESETGGNAIWTETKTLPTAKGLFSTSLGSQTPFGFEIKFDKPYWLGIKIGGEAELTPRIALTSSGYSFSSNLAISVKAPLTLSQETNNPTLLSVNTSTNGGPGVWGESSTGAGVLGKSNVWVGTYGETSTWFGVWGKATGDNGKGVVGESATSYGVWGVSPNGAGVVGESQKWVGVYGQSNDNAGIWGKSTNGYGVYGESVNGMAGFFNGRVGVKVLQINGGSDLAEPFEISKTPSESEIVNVEPGSVMIIDDKNPGKLKISNKAYDKKVAGIVSGAGGINPGLTLQQDGILEGDVLIAISGRVYCKAEAFSKPIKAGDLLTTSNIPGYAMKATDNGLSHGAVIGKAMTELKSGKGLVLVLVNLQ